MTTAQRRRSVLDYGASGVAMRVWARAWMMLAGIPLVTRPAVRLATWGTPPHYGRHRLARYSRTGYVAPSARIHHRALRRGENVFIGDGVIIYEDVDGGVVELGDRVHLNEGVTIQTGAGGRVVLGADTHLQPRCQLSAYKAAIVIGRDVQIAPACAFYPYDHAMSAGTPMRLQRMTTKGDIVVEDDAWLGHGVIVLSGVRVGAGAVIGAGAVVTSDIPAGAIAVGAPARVLRKREVTRER